MMTREEKTLQLRQQIATQVGDLIDRDYVLLGLPYYLNVGDILIWEGERQFLSTFCHKCLNEGYRYKDYWRIRNDTLILLQGGGNFGDLWRFIQAERLSIVQRYRNNPIVIFPVTCWYENTALLRQDAEALSKHPNLMICARDAFSFELLRKHFNNRILLVPDMAFSIEITTLARHIHAEDKETLFLKRTDKELAPNTPSPPRPILNTADVRDWPSMEKDPPCWILYRNICKYFHVMGQYRRLRKLSHMMLKSSDWYYQEHCRKQLMRKGVRFVSRYRKIYTTRLHVGILSVLLNKEVTIIDNSYGKNATYFESWLSDTDGVKLWKSN
jgi:exopolysaccharide biosynthesis predicted pyruvyltransferase EpsI